MSRLRERNKMKTYGEVSEWFKELVLKTSDTERYRGFESHLLRIIYLNRKSLVCTSSLNKFCWLFGEVPKRLKGLAWKVSRSLIAAQGFKSLLLRCEYNRKKKFLTFSRENARIYRMLKKQQKTKQKSSWQRLLKVIK